MDSQPKLSAEARAGGLMEPVALSDRQEIDSKYIGFFRYQYALMTGSLPSPAFFEYSRPSSRATDLSVRPVGNVQMADLLGMGLALTTSSINSALVRSFLDRGMGSEVLKPTNKSQGFG